MADRYPDLYGISSGEASVGEVVARVGAALGAGLKWVQIREKQRSSRDLANLVGQVVAVARPWGARVLVNDRCDIAVATGADGVHLTEQSLDVATVRQAFPDLIIGASAHSCERAQRAADEGADFVLIGPIFDTPSKRAYGAPLGLATLESIASSVALPVVAVGGIGPTEVAACLAAGAKGVAAIRTLLGSRDIVAAVREYRAGLSSLLRR